MRLAVINEGEVTVTETFIRAHATRLPGRVHLIHDYPPRIGENGRFRPVLPIYASRGLARRVGLLSHREHLTRTYCDIFRYLNIDLVLAEYGPTAVAVRKACEMINVPLAVHFHGYDAYRKAEVNRYKSEYLKVFAQAEAIVAVSQSMCNQLEQLGAPNENIFLNPCGVDTNIFLPPSNQEKKSLHFLSVGRFVEKKAPHLTLLAFAKVHHAHPGARLTMIGDGHLQAACIDLAMALGISEAVDFAGSQPHEQVQQALHRALALVQHSITGSNGDSEGAPVSIMEAGASGLPVISTFHAGIPDIVKHEETGLLCDERDLDEMASNMCRLAADEETALAMGRRARKRIEKHFSMDQSIERLHTILAWAGGENEDKPSLMPHWIQPGVTASLVN